MQRGDIERFADTLADGFSQYDLFKYACHGKYDHRKMSYFWAFNIVLNLPDAICIADSKEVNSVLIYIPPRSKEPGLLSCLKAGIVEFVFRIGLRRSIRLSRFDAEAQSALIDLVRSHEFVAEFGVFPQHDHQQSGGGGVKGAAMAHFGDVVAVSQKVDHVETGPSGGFVDGNDACPGKDGQMVSFGIVTHNKIEAP